MADNKLLRFVSVPQQMPEKRPATTRAHDFNEIYAEYVAKKAEEQKAIKQAREMQERRQTEMLRTGRDPDSEEARPAPVVQTMRGEFPAIETFAVKGPWKSEQTKAANLIFFAGNPVAQRGQEAFVTKVTEMAMNRQLPGEAVALLNTHRSDPWPKGLELTDDFAPYDVLVGKDVAEGR